MRRCPASCAACVPPPPLSDAPSASPQGTFHGDHAFRAVTGRSCNVSSSPASCRRRCSRCAWWCNRSCGYCDATARTHVPSVCPVAVAVLSVAPRGSSSAIPRVATGARPSAVPRAAPAAALLVLPSAPPVGEADNGTFFRTHHSFHGVSVRAALPRSYRQRDEGGRRLPRRDRHHRRPCPTLCRTQPPDPPRHIWSACAPRCFRPLPPHPDPTPRRGRSRLAWYAPRPSYCISSRGPLRGLGGATRANPTRRRGSPTRMRPVVESPPGVDRRGGGATDEQDGGEGRLNRRIGQQGASRTIEGSGAKNGYAMRRRNNRQTGRWRVVVYQTISKAGAEARQFFYTIDTWLPTAAPRLHEIGSAPLARHKTALII